MHRSSIALELARATMRHRRAVHAAERKVGTAIVSEMIDVENASRDVRAVAYEARVNVQEARP